MSWKRQPVFAFQEGSDYAGKILAEIARVSGGAYTFDGQSADLLRSLLSAVARYASGGRKADTINLVIALLSQLTDDAHRPLYQGTCLCRESYCC